MEPEPRGGGAGAVRVPSPAGLATDLAIGALARLLVALEREPWRDKAEWSRATLRAIRDADRALAVLCGPGGRA